MKYNLNTYLYYVDPYIFTIYKVYICNHYEFEDGDYYIEKAGVYLHEYDLFDKLRDAKIDALQKLRKFYVKKEKEIELTHEEGFNNENDFSDF